MISPPLPAAFGCRHIHQRYPFDRNAGMFAQNIATTSWGPNGKIVIGDASPNHRRHHRDSVERVYEKGLRSTQSVGMRKLRRADSQFG